MVLYVCCTLQLRFLDGYHLLRQIP
uniref:Uncharacterized protein n=1 Tax=Rhizophora mucronata TaxID=61149 RepID=A0A2P2NAI1_RHIMU